MQMKSKQNVIFFKTYQFLEEADLNQIDLINLIEKKSELLMRIKVDASVLCHINDSPKGISFDKIDRTKQIWEIMIFGSNNFSLTLSKSVNHRNLRVSL